MNSNCRKKLTNLKKWIMKIQGYARCTNAVGKRSKQYSFAPVVLKLSQLHKWAPSASASAKTCVIKLLQVRNQEHKTNGWQLTDVLPPIFHGACIVRMLSNNKSGTGLDVSCIISPALSTCPRRHERERERKRRLLNHSKLSYIMERRSEVNNAAV